MPAPRKRRVAHSPWTDLLVQSKWSVTGVRHALDEHEQGICYQSGKLIDALGRDPRIGHPKAGLLGTRSNALLGAPFRLRPADEDNPRAVRIAEEMEPHWWTVCPEATTRELLRYYWLGGAGPGQLRWQKRELRRGRTKQTSWLPIVESWQLTHFRHEETSSERELRRKVIASTQDGELEVTPGDGTWLMLHDGPRWWLNGSVRSMAVPWLGVQLTARDWWRHSERLGMPIIKAMYPDMAEDETIDNWLADLKGLATETTATLPRGINGQEGMDFDLDLLEAAQESPESFEKLIQHVYVNFAIHLLGHNLSAEVREGQAVTADGAEVRADYKRADAETLSTQYREQIVIPWAAEWYPDGEELAPWPTWDVEPKEDAKAKAETQKTAAETLKVLKETGHRPKDLNAWAEPYDLELEEIEEEEPEPTPPPPMPPGQPPEGEPEGLLPGEAEADDVRIASPEEIDELYDRYAKPKDELATMLADLKQDDFAGGLRYADKLVEAGVAHSRAAMAPAIRAALDAVDGASTPEEARQALLGAFAGMDPEKLAGWLERAIVLAELKGQESVLGEL